MINRIRLDLSVDSIGGFFRFGLLWVGFYLRMVKVIRVFKWIVLGFRYLLCRVLEFFKCFFFFRLDYGCFWEFS